MSVFFGHGRSHITDRSRGARRLATAVLVACVASGCRSPERSPPIRLVDRAGDQEHTLVIDGLRLRVLDPQQAEHVLTLPDSQPPSRLVFAIGVGATAPAVVRFEIELRSAGGSARGESLYRRDIASGRWTEETVEIPGRSHERRDLVLRRTLVEGPAAALAVAGWGDPVLLPDANTSGPTVILVSIDTLRADRVQAYGAAHAPATPAIDKLARTAVMYEEAYAPSTWTVPSHQALFFGRPPIGLPFPPGPEPATLTEALRRAGFLTAGFTGGGYVSALWGFAAGFDEYYEFTAPEGSGPPTCDPARLDGPEVFRRATEWLRRYRGAPAFLFVHTYDAHDRCPFAKPPFTFLMGLRRKDRDQIAAYYGTQVTSVDGLVGSFLAELERDGLFDETLLVITSDHGEALWEHGFGGHGPNLKPYFELARVPLIVRIPGRGTAGARVPTPVSVIDVAPTILRALDVVPPASMRGRPLPGLGIDDTDDGSAIYVDAGDVLAVRSANRVLISNRRLVGRHEAYDVDADPNQRRILPLDPSFAVLRALAREYWRGHEDGHGPAPARDGDAIDPATRERLRALGYLD